ncbi:DNA/RNA non-specific endonuclease [Sinorhizobium meliloti]|uniref:Serine protease n=1 Tax=Rhizobium meliloti TaxID=382 RepID=A0A2J0YT27_RHIML|nr:DNA/RNA non-specific endonuclease [Sinorhizobium meliloti]PJR08741.1 protease [Sinorhizobium meliloti]
MYRSQLDQVRSRTHDFRDRAARILAARRAALIPAAAPHPLLSTLEFAAEGRAGSAPSGTAAGALLELVPEALGQYGWAEAIVLAELRPAFFVFESAIDVSDAVEADPELLGLVSENQAALLASCKGVGRVDLTNHFSLPYGGTGFLIDDTLVVTNRHVALIFAERLRMGYRFRRGRFGAEMEARLDYHGFLGSVSKLRAEVTEVLYIAADHEPDFALLRVARLDEAPKLELLGGTRRAEPQTPVAVVGYPAEDGDRNDKPLMDEVFRGQYEVKRLAPGFVTSRSDNDIVLLADYSSLGGNSGSPVIDLSSGKVLGLHFAGRFMENNYAVAADVIESARAQVIRSLPAAAVPVTEPVSKPDALADRNGYDPHFLGTRSLSVPLPGLGPWMTDVAPVSGAADNILRYRNFSVIQSASRRLPLLTAVNIDGMQSVVLKRKGEWRLDGRIKAEHQIGNALYAENALDRGHMVRRRDPSWGPNAQEAEIDTFHYTNSAPQHEDLNQKDWVGLEDYVLEAAETRGFRLSVMTGPVFDAADRRLKAQPGADAIQIPEEFWKVAVMVNDAAGRLSATGYVLSQGRMIRHLVESPFVYGQYKTYQVRIALIAAETGLDFSAIIPFDPLGAEMPTEANFAEVARVVNGPGSLVLGSPGPC